LSAAFNEGPQPLGPAGAQFPQCLGFYLPETLAGHVELFAYVFQCVVGSTWDREAMPRVLLPLRRCWLLMKSGKNTVDDPD